MQSRTSEFGKAAEVYNKPKHEPSVRVKELVGKSPMNQLLTY